MTVGDYFNTGGEKLFTMILFNKKFDGLVRLKGKYYGYYHVHNIHHREDGKVSVSGVSSNPKLAFDEFVKYVMKDDPLILTNSVLGVNFWFVLKKILGKEVSLGIASNTVDRYLENVVKELDKNINSLHFYPAYLHPAYKTAYVDDVIKAPVLILDKKFFVVPAHPDVTPSLKKDVYYLRNVTSDSSIPYYMFSYLRELSDWKSFNVNGESGSVCLVGSVKHFPLLLFLKHDYDVIKEFSYSVLVNDKWVTGVDGEVKQGFFPQFKKSCHHYNIINSKFLFEFCDVLKRHLYIAGMCYGTLFYSSLRKSLFSNELDLNKELKLSFWINNNGDVVVYYSRKI